MGLEFSAVLIFGTGDPGSPWDLFPHPEICRGTGNRMAVRAWGSSLCSLRLFPLPRYDSRTVRMGSHQIRTAVPETAGIQIRKPVLFLHGRESAAGGKDDGKRIGASGEEADETEETKEAKRKG